MFDIVQSVADTWADSVQFTVTLALKNIAMSYPAADYYSHPRSKEKHEK